MFDTFGYVGFVSHTRLGEFVTHLRAGRLVAARCLQCGATSLPPRADCADCLGAEFEWVETSGAGTLFAFTTVVAPPAGFERLAPYTLGLVALDNGARLLAPLVEQHGLTLGDPVRVVPHIVRASDGERVLFQVHPHHDSQPAKATESL